MKKITIRSLKLHNFKGIASLTVPFTDEGIVIAGANATGKTTIQDAFTWLLFGKDAQDRANFEIKTIGMQRAEHSVTAVLSVDGNEVTMKRVYREKWTRRRGSAEDEFTGHETEYFINDVPQSQKEYQEYVNGIIQESTFKLVTNPTYFNSLKKEQRRDMLIAFAGKISDDEIAGDNAEIRGLLHIMLIQQKTAEALKKEYASKRKRIEEEMKSVPGRIEETRRAISETAIPNLPDDFNETLEAIDAQIAQDLDAVEKNKAQFKEKDEKIQSLQQDILKIKTEHADIINNHKISQQQAHHAFTSQIATLTNQKIIAQNAIKAYQNTIEDGQKMLSALRNEFSEASALRFSVNENDLNCHACGQTLPDANEKRDALRFKFNTDKELKLRQLNERGVELKNKIEKELPESIEQQKQIHIKCDTAIAELRERMSEPSLPPEIDTTTLIGLEEQLNELLASASEAGTGSTLNYKELEAKRDALLDLRSNREALIKVFEANSKRLTELESQLKTLASEKANVERQEFVIEMYRSKHDQILEQRVNKHFSRVQFSLFKNQINGGVEEVCETLVNGVPWLDANNAGRINAGIEICNVFAKRMNVQAPIWVDNAEAVNEIIPSPSQLIKLVVTTDKQLTVLNTELWLLGEMVEAE